MPVFQDSSDVPAGAISVSALRFRYPIERLLDTRWEAHARGGAPVELFPEMSSRDLNHLIVAWDEAAADEEAAQGALEAAGAAGDASDRNAALYLPAAGG